MDPMDLADGDLRDGEHRGEELPLCGLVKGGEGAGPAYKAEPAPMEVAEGAHPARVPGRGPDGLMVFDSADDRVHRGVVAQPERGEEVLGEAKELRVGGRPERILGREVGLEEQASREAGAARQELGTKQPEERATVVKEVGLEGELFLTPGACVHLDCVAQMEAL